MEARCNIADFDQHDINRLFVLVENAFRQTTDKVGNPYIGHCAFVANNARALAINNNCDRSFAELCYIVGLCHDVFEDCDQSTVDSIKTYINTVWSESKYANANRIIIDAIESVTRHPGEKYKEYFERASAHPIGVYVKCADALHNSNYGRMSSKVAASMTEQQMSDFLQKCQKYRKRYEKLLSMIEK